LYIAKSSEAALAGLLLLIFPAAMISLLFGSQLHNAEDTAVGRGAGVAIFALGVGWWMLGVAGHAAARLIGTMLLYDIAAIVILLFARFTQGLNGVGLWPAVALHLALGIWCLVCLSRQNWANE
jgi:hypothetical protein